MLDLEFEYFPIQAIRQDFRNNSNNHPEYSPFLFIIDNKILIDNYYYKFMNENIKEIFNKKYELVIVENFTYPHEDQENYPLYYDVYNIYTLQSREEYWLGNMKDQSFPNKKFMIEIPLNIVDDLINNKTINTSNDFIQKIDKILETNEAWFFKTSTGSVKHDIELEPVHKSSQIIECIKKSERLMKDLDKTFRNSDYRKTYLILTKWVDIDKENEYRIFVTDGIIRAICQQYWYKVSYKTNDERKHIYSKICILIEKLDIKIGVCDIWFDKKNNMAYLIEINAFGPGLSSGSAIFHWIRDKDILWSKIPEKCVWRILC